MNRIAIIGTGRLGTRLAEQIILGGLFDELYLWNRSKEKLRGTILSLSIWGYQICSRTKVIEINWELIESYNIIVIAIKEKYDVRSLYIENIVPKWIPNNLRYTGLMKDLPQIKEVCSRLTKYTGKIVVITNPVDLITSFISKWLPGCFVFGLGSSVDSVRLSYLITKIVGNPVLPYSLLVGGEHGYNIVPFVSLWDNKELLSKGFLKNLPKLLIEANELSINIVKDLGYTLQDCAEAFSHDISWLSGSFESQKYSVFSIYKDMSSIGIPVYRDANNQIIIAELSTEEQNNLNDIKSKLSRMMLKFDDTFFLNYSSIDES